MGRIKKLSFGEIGGAPLFNARQIDGRHLFEFDSEKWMATWLAFFNDRKSTENPCRWTVRNARRAIRQAGLHGPQALILLLLLFMALPTRAEKAEDPLRVLFIGNSQTSRNELPKLVERFSLAAGVDRPVVSKRITLGGESFYRHSERRDEGAPIQVIGREPWDFVVLQENTRVAVAGRETLIYAGRLVRAVREAGAEPLFYMTWAYRDEPEMQPAISRTYFQLGTRLKVPVAPVGEAFRRTRKAAPEIRLFETDGSHPSPEGSYLAASVLFAKLYGRSPVGVPLEIPGQGAKVAEISSQVAERLQQLAWQTLENYRQPHGD